MADMCEPTESGKVPSGDRSDPTESADETRVPKVCKPACDQKRAFSPETDIIPQKENVLAGWEAIDRMGKRC